jgi:TPR repeat protein
MSNVNAPNQWYICVPFLSSDRVLCLLAIFASLSCTGCAPDTLNQQAGVVIEKNVNDAPISDPTSTPTNQVVQANNRPDQSAQSAGVGSGDIDIDELAQKANAGDGESQYQLGIRYLDDDTDEQNYPEGVKWLRLSAERGHAGAQRRLGYCYKTGTGVEKDLVEAVRWYRLAAEQGYATAQNNLGFCYESGQGVEKDLVEAVRWYRLAAKKINEAPRPAERATERLLGLLETGRGVAPILNAAFIYAKKGSDEAQASKARFLLETTINAGELDLVILKRKALEKELEDIATSFKRLSSGQTNTPAPDGLRIVDGQWVFRETRESAERFRAEMREAAERGDAKGKLLGNFVLIQTAIKIIDDVIEQAETAGIRDENEGEKAKSPLVFADVRTRAERGDAQAQLELGRLYEEGLQVRRDNEEAVKWYRLAAEQGLEDAQVELGLCYAEELGVKRDYAEAYRLFSLAADKGFPPAQLCLANLLIKGRGVRRDEGAAAIWNRRAAEQGFADAQFNLGLCYLDGTGVEKNEEEAFKWFLLAAEQGLADAQVNVGGMYVKGIAVERNDREAVKWYRRAAQQGNVTATRALLILVDEGKFR